MEGHIEYKISPYLFEYINDLKSLEYLFLSYCEFDYNFKLKLENLKEIHFNLCRKIYFKNNIFLKLQKLILRNCDIYKADSLLKCPLLEKCSLIHGYFENNQLTYDKFIDFSSIVKLKKYKGNAEYFLLINNNNPLENVTLLDDMLLAPERNKNMFLKICSIKTIKKIDFPFLGNFNYQDITNIKDENPSVEKMIVTWSGNDNLCNLDILYKLFPNLTNLIFVNSYNCNAEKPQIQIIENSKSRIANIELFITLYNIKIYCNSFEKLESIKFNIRSEITDLQNSFPIFKDKCKIIFQSLKSFHFIFEDYYIDLDIINNIYKNINNMPNLEEFILLCNCDVKNEFYIEFIKKIISLKYIKIINIKLKGINVSIQTIKLMEKYDYIYSKDELTKLFSDININKFYEIIIIKNDIKTDEECEINDEECEIYDEEC